MTAPLLVVDQLNITFPSPEGEVKAVRGLSFSLEQGETLALIGESGAGKSVTARALIGFHREYRRSGQFYFNGKNVTDLSEKQWEKIRGKEIGFLPQEERSSLNPVHPVGKQVVETIQKHRRLPWKQAKSTAYDLLRQVGFPRPEQYFFAYPHQLSGGLRQRILLAIALSGRPRLLIADEPTTGLDATTKAYIIELLAVLKKEYQLTILLITHDLKVAASLGNRVLVIRNGQKVKEGKVNAIFRDGSIIQEVSGIDKTNSFVRS